jgi:hypothetical protein
MLMTTRQTQEKETKGLWALYPPLRRRIHCKYSINTNHSSHLSNITNLSRMQLKSQISPISCCSNLRTIQSCLTSHISSTSLAHLSQTLKSLSQHATQISHKSLSQHAAHSTQLKSLLHLSQLTTHNSQLKSLTTHNSLLSQLATHNSNLSLLSQPKSLSTQNSRNS